MANKDTAPVVEEMEEQQPMVDPWNDLVDFRIPRTKGDNGARKFLALNGRTFSVKPGVNVKIPRCVAEMYYRSVHQKEENAALIDELVKDADY